MTTQELKKIIKECPEDFGRFVQDLWGETGKYAGLEFEVIDEERSADGDHDTYHYYLKVNDEVFRVSGYYSSENGIDMSYCESTITKVEKKEVTRVEWVQVKE